MGHVRTPLLHNRRGFQGFREPQALITLEDGGYDRNHTQPPVMVFGIQKLLRRCHTVNIKMA